MATDPKTAISRARSGAHPARAELRRLGVAAAVICLAASAAMAPAVAWGSALLAPAVGAADNATMGTRIADPHTPSSALFENPAGLTGFETLTHTAGAGIGYGHARIEASVPAGYNESNDIWVFVPDFGLSIPYRDRWRFAVGSYGSTGSKFDFAADPAAQVPSFFSETIVIAVPLGVAYRLTDQVSVGVEVQPMFGQLRTHFPAGNLDFKYKVNGPGVQGMVGMTVRPSAQWAFGLSVRTPGIVWMSGSMPVPNMGRQGVHTALEMPTQVFLGATWHPLPRLTLSGSSRFTDASSFGDSTIEYQLTPQANSSFVPDAKDEWKFGLAAEYALQEQTMLRLGFSWASRIVGAKGVSPLVFDGDDTMFSIGLGQRFGSWTVDAMAGYDFSPDRHISPSTALVLPGTYSMGGAIGMLGLTYRQ